MWAVLHIEVLTENLRGGTERYFTADKISLTNCAKQLILKLYIMELRWDL